MHLSKPVELLNTKSELKCLPKKKKKRKMLEDPSIVYAECDKMIQLEYNV